MRRIDIKDLNHENVMKVMKKVKMFSYMEEDECQLLLDKSEILLFDENEYIIKEGEVQPCLYIILSGRVRVSKTRHEKEKLISYIRQGDVFGEAGIFINMKRTADVIADESVHVLRMDRQILFQFFKRHPDSGVKVLMFMTYSLLNKLRETHEEILVDTQSNIDPDDFDRLMHN